MLFLLAVLVAVLYYWQKREPVEAVVVGVVVYLVGVLLTRYL